MFEFFVILKGRYPNFLEQNNTKLNFLMLYLGKPRTTCKCKKKIIDPPQRMAFPLTPSFLPLLNGEPIVLRGEHLIPPREAILYGRCRFRAEIPSLRQSRRELTEVNVRDGWLSISTPIDSQRGPALQCTVRLVLLEYTRQLLNKESLIYVSLESFYSM